MLAVWASAANGQNIAIKEIGRYTDGRSGALEIVTYDSSSKKLFITNAASDSIDIVDVTNPATPTRSGGISIKSYGGSVTSVVSLNNGFIAAAIPAATKTDSGKVVFFSTAGVYANSVKVGALPDMITVTKDGKKVLVANEGEPNDDYTIDPKGSVGIINISSGVAAVTQADVTLLTFEGAPATIAGSHHKSGSSWAEDLEPEYIAVNDAGTIAVAGCQEANVFVFIDLLTNTITSYKGLGFKDHNLAGNGIDASDRDSRINIRNWPVKGVYMPDAITAYSAGGNTYYVTANEGDSRDYDGYSSEARVKDMKLDPTVFPTGDDLKKDTAIGRIKTFTTDVIGGGDTDGDGDLDEIHTYGARSFSIWDAAGNLVWDSGDDFEQYINDNHSDFFNCDEGKASTKDTRSDDKGVEPEAVITGRIGTHTFAFIGLERQSGIMVYDITNPSAPVFDTFLHTYQASGTSIDVAPEGMIFVPAAQSHTKKNLLIVSHEVSGTTTIFQVDDLSPSNIPGAALEATDWKAYPNPAFDLIHLQIGQVPAAALQASLYNTMGVLVKTTTLQFSGNTADISIGELPSGIYFLSLTDELQHPVATPKMIQKQ